MTLLATATQARCGQHRAGALGPQLFAAEHDEPRRRRPADAVVTIIAPWR